MGFWRTIKISRLAKKAHKGDNIAYENLCEILLFDKMSSPEDQEKGYKIAKMASVKGDRLASVTLLKVARCYEHGIVVQKDLFKAKELNDESKKLQAKCMTEINAKTKKYAQEPAEKSRWDKQREAKAKTPKVKTSPKSAPEQKYTKVLKYCATCNYWQGERTIEPLFYRHVAVKSHDVIGLCLNTNGRMLRHKLKARSSCPQYEKWHLLT